MSLNGTWEKPGGMGPNDPRPAGHPARELDREVDRLPPADPVHHLVEPVRQRAREHPGEESPGFAYQVMIPDIVSLKRLRDRTYHAGIPVSQVEDAAVAVTVHVPRPVLVVNKASLPPARDQHHAVLRIGVHLPGRDVLCEQRYHFFS